MAVNVVILILTTVVLQLMLMTMIVIMSTVGQAKVIAEMTEDGTGHIQLRLQPFASAEKLRDVVADTYRQLKQRRADIQRKMSLYLTNRDTEFILFKPMKVSPLYFFIVLLENVNSSC